MSEANYPPAQGSASAYAHVTTVQQFAGRKGHGGGPCTRRVLNPGQLSKLLAEAFAAGEREAKMPNTEVSNSGPNNDQP